MLELGACRVHGRLDLAGPPVTAWELARAWPDAELRLGDGGHTGGPDMTRCLIVATDASPAADAGQTVRL